MRASQVVLVVKNLANAGDIRDASSIPGTGNLLEEGLATYSSVIAWRIPWTEEHGELQYIGSQRVRHDWSDLAQHNTVVYEFWIVDHWQYSEPVIPPELDSLIKGKQGMFLFYAYLEQRPHVCSKAFRTSTSYPCQVYFVVIPGVKVECATLWSVTSVSVQLFVTPWTVAHQALCPWVSPGIELVGSSQPRDWTHGSCISCIAGRLSLLSHLGSP